MTTAGPSRRAYFIGALLWFGFIIATVPVGRGIVNALRGRALLGLGVTLGLIGMAVAAMAFVRWLHRRRLLSARQTLFAVLATVVILLLAQVPERAEERWHIVQYGILGVLCWGALPLAGWRRGIAAILLAAAAGWLDEGVQYFLPDRVYDLWDVLLNAISGAAGVVVVEATVRIPPQDGPRS